MVVNSTARIIMSLDLGTTSTRVALLDTQGNTVTVVGREHQQYFPQPGWVEHDAREIWANVCELDILAVVRDQLVANDIATIVITNQRETMVAWAAHTSLTVHRAIVWQDARTHGVIEHLQTNDYNATVQATTG